MKPTHLALKILLPIALIFAAQSRLFADSKSKREAVLIEQGRYLVFQVGLCIDCHSPRGPDGQFDESKHLTGSPLPFVPTVPMPWASAAPSLAGLPPHYTREAMARFLTTGERPGGLPPPLPPMPAYRMDPKDAAAVAAYLESLKPKP